MAQEAFSLLAEPIQRALVRMQWEQLRPIQSQAIHQILETDDDLIISAKTASGKTEAAFLPVLSHIIRNPGFSVRALYVGPLKALINDQFRRLDELCEYAEIPVHRWHGDVSQNRKDLVVREPRGVLLITPESIESLFVNRSSRLSAMFHDLSFVVIDELHAFLGSVRGTHLRSLLCRLQRHARESFRLIALSATLGDIEASTRWLRPDSPDRVFHINDSQAQKEIKYRIYGYLTERPNEEDATTIPADAQLMAEEMFAAFAGTTNLIFANRKNDVELFADLLNERCRRSGRPTEFLVHHGSLSKEIREQTETIMRGDRPATTVCSPTLELGIDIGNVVAVGQIGVPWSVSSLVQRIGRSGRRDGQPSIMRVYIRALVPGPDSDLVDRIFPEFLQAIAMTELMLEKWIEPPNLSEMDFSTLLQQILSVIAETGGIQASAVFDRLVSHGAFRKVDQQLFVKVLRAMAQQNLIEQMPEGDLILGLKGQRIVSHYDFYTAFMTPDDYQVVYNGSVLGTLPALYIPEVGDHLLFAARRWQIAAVDHERAVVSVVPARGRKPPRFGGGEGEVHPRLRLKAHDVLLSDTRPAYLSEDGHRILQQARTTAGEMPSDDSPFVQTSDHSCIWFTWTGTRIQRTLMLMGRMLKLNPVDREVALFFETSPAVVKKMYTPVLDNPPDPVVLARLMPTKQIRKYDHFLSDDLLELSLGQTAIDVPGALDVIRRTCS